MVAPHKSEFKPSPLGPIPIDWEVKVLSEISSVKRGRFSPRPRNDTRFYGGNIPFVQTGDVSNSNGRVSTFSQTLNEEGLKVSILFPKGTILITIAANIGHTAILDIDMACPDSLVGIICKRNTDNEYLNYQFQYSQKRIEHFAPGAQKNIGVDFLDTLPVVVPSFREQRAISSALLVWDKAIEKTTQLITAKEQRKKWLMQQLLSGRKRLRGFNESWKRVSAGEVFENVSVKGFDSEELLSAKQDKGIIPRNMLEGRVTMPTGETTSFKLVEVGDFVISLRSFQGGLEYSYYRGLVSPAYTVLKPRLKINDEFYKYYYKSYDFIGHLATAVIGIRDGKQISYDEFCVVRIPNPSYAEQTAIANILQTADKEINLLKQKLEAYKEQKKGLMQVLLTGKVRLKTN